MGVTIYLLVKGILEEKLEHEIKHFPCFDL